MGKTKKYIPINFTLEMIRTVHKLQEQRKVASFQQAVEEAMELLKDKHFPGGKNNDKLD
jgi:hypothetical protein